MGRVRVVLTSWAVLVACGDVTVTDVAPPPKRDAGPPPVSVRDGGTTVTPRDAGEAPPPMDAGVVDAGEEAPRDAGTRDGGDEMPPLRMPPPPPTYSNGTCPTLVTGPTSGSSHNQNFMSGTDSRSFRVIVPMNYDPSRAWPVVFAWHWLNASSNSFVRDGELDTATEEMGFIAVVPDKLLKPNGDKEFLFDWPFVEVNEADRDLVFFDDMLACVNEQLNIDLSRLYAIGVSAGGLWVTFMSSTDRVDRFAAVETLSGGLGSVAGVWNIEFTPRPHKFPALVLWGGPRDWLGLSFHDASQRYRDALLADGHFVVACTHDSGHSMPPIEPPVPGSTKFFSIWQFMLDHRYGLAPGDSPYSSTGLPSVFPDWCEIP